MKCLLYTQRSNKIEGYLQEANMLYPLRPDCWLYRGDECVAYLYFNSFELLNFLQERWLNTTLRSTAYDIKHICDLNCIFAEITFKIKSEYCDFDTYVFNKKI